MTITHRRCQSTLYDSVKRETKHVYWVLEKGRDRILYCFIFFRLWKPTDSSTQECPFYGLPLFKGCPKLVSRLPPPLYFPPRFQHPGTEPAVGIETDTCYLAFLYMGLAALENGKTQK